MNPEKIKVRVFPSRTKPRCASGWHTESSTTAWDPKHGLGVLHLEVVDGGHANGRWSQAELLHFSVCHLLDRLWGVCILNHPVAITLGQLGQISSLGELLDVALAHFHSDVGVAECVVQGQALSNVAGEDCDPVRRVALLHEILAQRKHHRHLVRVLLGLVAPRGQRLHVAAASKAVLGHIVVPKEQVLGNSSYRGVLRRSLSVFEMSVQGADETRKLRPHAVLR
eukprot:1533438-Rhodomonas_salina.2